MSLTSSMQSYNRVKVDTAEPLRNSRTVLKIVLFKNDCYLRLSYVQAAAVQEVEHNYPPEAWWLLLLLSRMEGEQRTAHYIGTDPCPRWRHSHYKVVQGEVHTAAAAFLASMEE